MRSNTEMQNWLWAIIFLATGIAVGATVVYLYRNENILPRYGRNNIVYSKATAGESSPVPVYQNDEEVEWTDWRGRTRNMKLKRNIYEPD